jgi:hypothetical protein
VSNIFPFYIHLAMLKDKALFVVGVLQRISRHISEIFRKKILHKIEVLRHATAGVGVKDKFEAIQPSLIINISVNDNNDFWEGRAIKIKWS